MTEETQDDRFDAIQNVVDRVSSYQDGATDSTVEKELRKAAAEADLDLGDDEITRLADAVEEHGGDVRVKDVLS